MRAFAVGVDGWSQSWAVYGAASRSKARYLACKAAQDAGYFYGLPRFRAVRAPEYDINAISRDRPGLLRDSHGDAIIVSEPPKVAAGAVPGSEVGSENK